MWRTRTLRGAIRAAVLLAAMLCAAALLSCAQKPPRPEDRSQAITEQIQSAVGSSAIDVTVRQTTFSTTPFYPLFAAKTATADWGYECLYDLDEPELGISFELMEPDASNLVALPMTPADVGLSRDDFHEVLKAFAAGSKTTSLRRFKRFSDEWLAEDATLTVGTAAVPARECYVLYSDAPDLSAASSESPGWMQYASVVHLDPRTHKARWLCPLEQATGSMSFPEE